MHIGGAAPGFGPLAHAPANQSPPPTVDVSGPAPFVEIGDAVTRPTPLDEYEPITDLIGRLGTASLPTTPSAATALYLPGSDAAPTLDLRI